MAELYAKPYELIDTGYNPQQTQQGGQDAEMQSYLESLPPEERQKAIERLNAPLTGEELALMAKSGQRKPTLEEFAEIEKFHKSHEVSFLEGLGKIAEGGEQVMTDLSNAFASFLDNPSDATSKMPATAVEAFAQGTRNFYGMLAQSQNTDSVLFRVKDFLNGTGTLEDRYNQYIDALEFNKQSADLVEGKQTLVMDKDMINHEVTQAMAYIADPTLFIPFGKVASTGLRAVGLGEKLTMAGARAAAIKNGIIGNTIKWGVGQPIEFMGGAVRNTIDYGLEKAGAAFEATTGISGKEFAQTARMSGVGFSASGIAGYAVPYASTVSDAYLVGSSAKGFGEALTLIGDTMKKNKFGRGINSWAAEALEQAEKNGVALSPHAKGLLKTLNAVDPLFAYGWNGLETAAEGAFIGGTLGYLSDNAEGMYSGIGAGIALGTVGGTAGKVVADITGGTNVARRAVQAKMVIEGHKVTNPEKAMFFQAMQKAAEIRKQDVDLVNGIIAGIDKIAPNFEFHGLTPQQFKIEAIKKGYNPETGKFVEFTSNFEGFGDRESKRMALSILRGLGGDFVGDRKAFIEALQKHGKVFTPEEIQKLTRDHIVSARARQLLVRYGFSNPKGNKTPWSQIDTPAQKKYIDGLLKGLSPEERAEVIKQYESVSSYEGQQEFFKNVDLSKDDLFDIQQNKGRRSSKYNPIIDSFNKLNKLQQEAILKEIDGQAEFANKIGGKHKLREFYEAMSWAEAWTDSVVKKFETDRQGAWADIKTALSQETKKNGERTLKGRNLVDKLTAEGFLDRDGNVLRERNLLNADMTFSEFAFSKGGVIERRADGKTHMYINLATMGDETFPHELFHTIMRESPMKKHFTDSLIQKLIGTIDKDGKLVRPAEVNIEQVKKFFKKYIDLTHRNNDGTLNAKAAEAKFIEVKKALLEYQQTGENKKISDRARDLIENYTEEFGAYYFSHWLMGRNRNTLFFGGELKGIEGVVERAKDSFKDFWQSKISKSNPEFDFSRGLNEAFDRSKGLGRISAMDYFMRDMVRAASNANKEVFRPDSMTLDNLRDFERSNGLRNLTAQGGTRRLNPREQVTQNIRLGKEAYKILSGLDKNLRTSKDVLDENGKQIITGRLSEAELDALVKGGIVPRAWADKVNQGYAMLDGTVSNIFSAGYLGRTEQTTDASYPRLTGKDVSFKNRKAVLFDVETKIKADGTFYTLFHTLDLAVIEQRANHLWQNADYRMLWNNDRGAMEADFFKYISNASKASTDNTKLDSAALLNNGDGFGSQRRDVLHQMAGMALQTGDAYKHQPIAVIPEGIRHSVTTFNIDGMTMPRVETGTRYDINMGNAHKFIRENWQPAEMRQEKTPSGVIMTHDSGFKFAVDKTGVTAFSSRNAKIGKFSSVKEATRAGKELFNSVHKQYDKVEESVRKNTESERKNFQVLEPHERQAAIDSGDVFSLEKVKNFVGNRKLIRQTREEFTIDRFEKDIRDNPEKLFDIFHNELREDLNHLLKLDSLNEEINKLTKQLADGVPVDDEVFINQDLFRLRNEWDNINSKIKNNHQAKRFYRLLEDIRTVQAVGGRVPTPMDVLANQNKIDLSIQGADEVLNQFKTELVATLDLITRGFLQRDGDVEFINGIYGREYNQQIQTGVPFVTIGTHGTKHIEMMMAREILQEKLGSRYAIESSQSGGFFSGGQHTSSQYAEFPPIDAKEILARKGIPQTAKELVYTSNAARAEWNQLIYSEMPRLVEDLLVIYFNGKDADGFYTGINGNKITEPTLLKVIIKDVLGFDGSIDSVPHAQRADIFKNIIESSVFDPTKGAPLINLSAIKNNNIEGINTFHDYVEYAKKTNTEENFTHLTKYGFLKSLANRLVEDASDRVLYSEYTNGILGVAGWKIANRGKESSSAKSVSVAHAFAEAYQDIAYYRTKYGHHNDLKQSSSPTSYSYYEKLWDWKSDHYHPLVDEVASIGTKIDVPMPKNVQMQTRALIRMDNPLVIEGRKSYQEYYLKDKIRPAIAAGHDGIVFRDMRDGGNFDNIYILFKNGLKDNQLGLDTSFDDVAVPRGNDETGQKVRYGTELGLQFQPTDANEAPKRVKGIDIDFVKAYDVFRQEYEQSTGQSWSMEKFMQRARNWEFFGDENGFVAVRPQRSGFVKLVGMAGDNKSKLRAIQQIKEQGLPVWGMVSKDIKDMAVKRGMREPNMIERTLLKQALNSAALGDAEILGYTPDNGVRLRYPDIGEVTKYMVGSPEYYKKLRSDFGKQIKSKIGFQPTEGEQGGRTYTPEQMNKEFIGKYASENKEITKGLKINHGIVIGRMGQEAVVLMKNGEMIGRLTWMTDKQNGHTYDIAVEIEPEYQGKKYQHLLYSEAYERMRAKGFKETYQDIYNEQGIPAKSQIKILGKDAGTFTDRNFKQKKLTYDAFMREMKYALKNGDEFVPTEAKLDPKAWYQPVERKIPTRDEGFNRVYREISRNKKASARSIKQAYLDKWGIDLNDYERYKQLEDAVHDLEFRRNNNEYEGTEREYYDERQELLNEYNELESAMTDQITGTQGNYAHRFNDQEGEITSGIKSIERIIDDISKVPLDTVDTFSGKNRLDALLKRRLGSGFAQEITGDNVFIADAFREYAGIKYEREMLGAAFESELYSSEFDKMDYTGDDFIKKLESSATFKNRKGILIDILRSENKLTKEGNPQGEVNPRRIINALRNKSGGDSKVYAEAKAIGLIDWLESKQEGKNQKKVTTKELIEFVENNKMGLAIDPQLEQAADFGSTRPYVTGGEEQAKKGYRVYVVHMMNPKHKHGVEGHFGGAVVHVRVTLRDSKDGKKVMHIEEIQANNTATNELSPKQKEIVLKEIQILERLKKETDILDEDHRRALSNARNHSYVGDEENTALEYKKLAIESIDKVNYEKKDKHRRKYAEQLYDLNPEFWQDKFDSNKEKTRERYIELTDRWLLSHNIDMFVSEKKTAANSARNNAPLQDPKEWVKVAFRTVLRKALVEGVDRITITPWSETPLQVGMKAKSAERFYGKTIVDAFNSELQKMNSRLDVANKSENIPRQKYEASKISTNEGLQRVATAVVPSELNGTKAKELFELLHKDDADLKSNHNYHALNTRFDYLINTIPDGTSGKLEIMQASKRRLQQFGDYLTMLEAQDKDAKTPSGRSVVASASNMSESEYLVDRSMGFDLTPEMKKKAARPQRMFQPAEYTEFKSEQSATGRILRNAKGYVIMLANNKFRVYNPAKAILGVYGSEEEAKKRIYREIPKQ